jgi:hypothetical protein
MCGEKILNRYAKNSHAYKIMTDEEINLRTVDYDVLRVDPKPITQEFLLARKWEGGALANVTRFNNNYGEVISAIQKAVRRGFNVDALYRGIDSFYSNNVKRTNVWNRLIVMSVEDVGPANPYVFLQVVGLWKNGRDSVQHLAHAILILCQARKSRVNDNLWLSNKKLSSEVEELAKHEKNTGQLVLTSQVGTPIQIKERLITALNEGDVLGAMRETIYLIFSPYELNKSTRRKGIRYKKAAWLILEAFEDLVGINHPYIRTCVEVATSNNWRWKGKTNLIYTHLINMYCNGEIPESGPIISEYPQGLDELILRVESGEFVYLGIPDYALDKHTNKGKNQFKRGIQHFLEVSSYIADEDEYWNQFSDEYRDMFIQLLKDTNQWKESGTPVVETSGITGGTTTSTSPSLPSTSTSLIPPIGESDGTRTTVANVKVKCIRPQYDNLQIWMQDPNNVYIGRQGIVFVTKQDGSKERWPKRASVWANPYKAAKIGREESIRQYREYIIGRLNDPNDTEVTVEKLLELRGKNLGCWCKPEGCHGDVLVELIESLSV